jgi:hypothetical protein
MELVSSYVRTFLFIYTHSLYRSHSFSVNIHFVVLYTNEKSVYQVQGFFDTISFLGEVELENLPLKKDALSHFGFPIKAHSGCIGKIKLQIPVRQFRTAPWCINIEKVYIVCGPINLDEVRVAFIIC